MPASPRFNAHYPHIASQFLNMDATSQDGFEFPAAVQGILCLHFDSNASAESFMTTFNDTTAKNAFFACRDGQDVGLAFQRGLTTEQNVKSYLGIALSPSTEVVAGVPSMR